MILEHEPKTEFEELGTHFIATFKRNSYEVTNPAAESGENSQKTTQKTTQKILELIAATPNISRTQLAIEIGITADGIKYHLDKLRNDGMIKRVGPDKGGYWEIVSISE